jgi:DNA-directed RNA polymerase subunit beta'
MQKNILENSKRNDRLKIQLASPNKILEWGVRTLENGHQFGEVNYPETINYRTFKPEPGGLFCEQIFGPTKDWVCSCGKYKGDIFKVKEPLFCSTCHVEITESKIRRERMGHIKLAYPVIHTWYLKSRPNFLSILLNKPIKEVEEIVYLIKTDKQNSIHNLNLISLQDKKLSYLNNQKFLYGQKFFSRAQKIKFKHWQTPLNYSPYQNHYNLNLDSFLQNETEKNQTNSYYNNNLFFKSDIFLYYYLITIKFNNIKYQKSKSISGTRKIRQNLENINFEIIIKEFCETLTFLTTRYYNQKLSPRKNRSDLKKIKLALQNQIRRLKVIQYFYKTKSRPEWVILSVLPVLPPGLRPLVRLDHGQFISSDLNELYRRIIYRNNRYSQFQKSFIPDIMMRNEKRLLQESVDQLINNGQRKQPAVNRKKTPFKSLSEIIKGKTGRFRQNLLGKRVDYSGRSVIIVNSSLKLHQCGLPRNMAIELFQPFLLSKLLQLKLVRNVEHAKKLIKKPTPLIWKILTRMMRTKFILLNRAPTLHRLGIQAFQPILTDGKAINLHPLVCSAFNADFDGDQMGVHIPLGWKAQVEAKLLMLACNNWLTPATGDPNILPSQDMVLGCYYLTVENLSIMSIKKSKYYFSNFDDVFSAYEQNNINLHSYIWLKWNGNIENSNENEEPLEIHVGLSGISNFIYQRCQLYQNAKNRNLDQYIRTTTGRVILNKLMNDYLKFY